MAMNHCISAAARPVRAFLAGALTTAGFTFGFSAPAAANPAFGLTTANQLVAFDTSTPGSALAPIAISGLQPGETALGIDVRPATGQIYLLGSTSRVYVVNPASGHATAVGAPFTPALSGT